MKKAFLLFLLPLLATAETKIEGALHGENLATDLKKLGSGKCIITLKEKRDFNGHKVFMDFYVIEIPLKEGDQISPFGSFKCTNTKNETIYGIISKDVAKKAGAFSPVHAWYVDVKEKKILPVKNVKEITCEFSPKGDATYPF